MGIEQKIDGITGAYLDEMRNVHVSIAPLFQRMDWVRIFRIARFWIPRENKERILLEQNCEDVIAGFYGQRSDWSFLLRGTCQSIECWFGITKEDSSLSLLKSTLVAAFPDIRLRATPPFDYKPFDRLNYSLVLTGIPTSKTDRKQPHLQGEQIEKLCRGLYGFDWIYLVSAHPLLSKEILITIKELDKEIRDTHTEYLLEANPTKKDRLVQTYIKLLEAKRKRFEQGRIAGMWETQVCLLTDSEALSGRAKALLHSAFSGERSTPEPIRILSCSYKQTHHEKPPLTILNSREVAILARLPHEEYPGYEIVRYVRFGVETNLSLSEKEKSVLVGDIIDGGRKTGTTLRIAQNDLTKHALIVGVTGSGKTNTCFHLLDQVWNGGKGVPFLVIESAKSEYRSLVTNPIFRNRFKGLRIFTIGKETLSPLRMNPFEVPSGTAVQTHLDYLKSLFQAAFVLYPPMPYVLEQSLQEVYEDRGWDVALNVNSRGESSLRRFPTLTDLIAKVKVVVARMGYDGEIKMNVEAGLHARLELLRLGGGKGFMLNTRTSIDSSILFDSPCLLELKEIVSDDEKAFIIGLLLIRLYEHYEGYKGYVPEGLRHVTLIEEAHRLLRNVSTEQGSEVAANPKGRAIEVFTNILSEIRAYGEGILIAEQIPTKLTPDAIKNTNLKIVHRLVAEDDRKIVGSTMNMTDKQTHYLTTLSAGEGVAFSEGMYKPVLLKVNKVKGDAFTISGSESERNVYEHMHSFRHEYASIFWPFPGCEPCSHRNRQDACSMKRSNIIDGQLKESFARLLNTFRLCKPYALEAYSEFVMQYQRLFSHNKTYPSPYCLFVELIESDIERRGEFWGWAYHDVEETVRLACAVAAMLDIKSRTIDKKELREAISGDLVKFSNICKRLHKIDILPFPGCQSCNDVERCFYRFDMDFPSDSIHSEDFLHSRSLLQVDPDIAEIIISCLAAAETAFFVKDAISLKGAALCFAVQQVSKGILTINDQRDFVNELSVTLNQR